MAGIGGGDERVTGSGFGRDVVVRGFRRSHSVMCGRAFGKGRTNTATEWLMATKKKLAMSWVT